MKIIPLTRGKVVVVEDEDYDRLMRHKWHFMTVGYAGRDVWNSRTKRKYKIPMHRQIMRAPRHLQVDHANMDGLDNRRTNLRLVTKGQNMMNGSLRRNKLHSIYKGVTRRLKDGRWIVQITKDKTTARIGSFDTEHHAALAYDLWAHDLFGEYARPNFTKVA